MPLRLQADREVCVGAGMCVLTAPELFDQDSETGRVVLVYPCLDAKTEDAAREAVALCPSGAITLVESGNGDTRQDGTADDASEDAEGESNG
jgi:ferredoxin